jgi:hypothetical protein
MRSSVSGAAERVRAIGRVRSAISAVVAAGFTALFAFIAVRRAAERDGIGAGFAAAMMVGLALATVRSFRRSRRQSAG